MPSDTPADLAALCARLAARPPDLSAAHPLRDAADKGADLSGFARSLAPHLEEDHRSLAVLVASALAFSAVNQADWDALLPLAGHRSRHVRWGTARALAERAGSGRIDVGLVDPLALATADPDREVRKQALEGLKDARKRGRLPVPSDAVLRELLQHLGRTPQVGEYVHDLIWRDPDLARRVREALTEMEGSEASTMLALCNDVLAGRIEPPCPICSNLESFEIAGQEEDLPAPAHQLVPNDAEVRHCPLCETQYAYAWHELYDDEWGSYGSYHVRRLAPKTGARSRRELIAGIAHPATRVQQECAVELASALFDEGDWEGMKGLLQHKQPIVRGRALGTLTSKAGPERDVSPLVPTLSPLLGDEEEDVRLQAARLLAWHQIRTSYPEGVAALLAFDNPTVRWSTCWALRDAAEERGLDLSPLRADLQRVTHDRDILARQSAVSTLKLALPSSAALIPSLVSMLGSVHPEVSNEAADELGTLSFRVKHGIGVDAALVEALGAVLVPLAAHLRSGHEHHSSRTVRILEELKEAGLDLTPARPDLEQAAASAAPDLRQRLAALVD